MKNLNQDTLDRGTFIFVWLTITTISTALATFCIIGIKSMI